MARPPEFERLIALEMAMQVFWSKGFAGASVNELTRAMGISKSSFYGAFGDKHSIFLEAIDFYCENVTERIRCALDVPGPARQTIHSILGRAVDRILEPDGRRGCFVNNIATERAPEDQEAAVKCGSGLTLMAETFESLVKRGQLEGDIAVERNPKKLAWFLTATVNGIMVIGKATPDRKSLDDIVEIAMSAIL